MALTKYLLGELITRNTEKNVDLKYGINDVRGVLNSKGISSTKADVANRDLSKFLVVRPGGFIFNHRVHDKLGLGYNTTNEVYIFTNDYVAFYVKPELTNTVLSPDYLYMWYLRSEFDRYILFNTYGSATLFFNWDNMCELEIELPPIEIQQRFVDIYKAMVENQKAYEKGLSDLKLTCDAYINSLDFSQMQPIKKFIERNTEKNKDGIFSKAQVKGIDNEGNFIKPMRLFSGDVETFKIIKTGCFVYNSRVNSTIKRLSIAFNEGDDLIVTPAYESFYVRKPDELYPYFLYMLLQRESFARKVLFNSFGSATLFFDIYALGDLKIPVPSIDEQKSIADIYRVYKKRQSINERLKNQIKDLCPILIRGSIEEAGKEILV